MMIDINDLPQAPDSNLDRDPSTESQFSRSGQSPVKIALGDWVDLDPTYVSPDPEWGYSFQVVGMYPEAGQVGVLMRMNPSNPDSYAEVSVSVDPLVTNNFMRVPDPEA